MKTRTVYEQFKLKTTKREPTQSDRTKSVRIPKFYRIKANQESR